MADQYITLQVGSVTIQQLNHPVASDPVVPVVTRRQALRALHDAGLLGQVENKINLLAEPERTAARIDWDNATEFRRDFPLLAQLASAMGLTAADIDNLFAAAAAIE